MSSLRLALASFVLAGCAPMHTLGPPAPAGTAQFALGGGAGSDRGVVQASGSAHLCCKRAGRREGVDFDFLIGAMAGGFGDYGELVWAGVVPHFYLEPGFSVDNVRVTVPLSGGVIGAGGAGFGWALLGLRVVVDLAPWLVAAGVHWNQVQDLAGDEFAGTVWGAAVSATYQHPIGDSDWLFLFAGELTGGGGPVRLEDVESRLGEPYVLGLVHLGFGVQ